MIGTIRKHSKWLWLIIATLTIVSFVYYFNPAQRMGGGGGGNASADLGSINGEKITPDAYASALREVDLFYLFRYGEWPEKNPEISEGDLERQAYARLLLIQKADGLGIYVSDDAVAAEADRMLSSPELARALRVNGDSVPLTVFVDQILKPKDLTATDFENFVRHALVIDQIVQAMGLPGALVTPQEAAAVYQRENQEISAQIIFFSASNYLSQIVARPAAVAQFYTNYLAAYRLPDRVQVRYVAFEMSNYLAQARTELEKTNLDEMIEANYENVGENYHGAKTPAEAKAKIREAMIQQAALADADKDATEFAGTVFSLDPPRAENLVTIAKQKGLAVGVTTPFSSQDGPEGLNVPAGFISAAFQLTSDIPLAGPIVGPDAVYVIALAGQFPSEIPSFDQIRDRVTQDYQLHEAAALAERAGTNFVHDLTASLAGGKSFAATCIAAGFQPQALPPFSLSTRELPELGDRVELNQFLQFASNIPAGHASPFVKTDDGGFILYVQSHPPLDEIAMSTELPQFTATLRLQRQNEAFNEWLNGEVRKEFGNMKIFQQSAADATK
jgi:hypothetical protein